MSELILNLGKVLIDYGKITLDDFEKALSMRIKTNKPLKEVFISEGIISEEDIIAVVGYHLNIPFLDPLLCEIDLKVTGFVPEELARQYKLFPLYKVYDTLHVAVAEALDIITIDTLRIALRCEIKQILAKEKAVIDCIATFYARQQTLPEILRSSEEAATKAAEETEPTDLIQESQKEPIIEAVDRFIQEAVMQGASDIHIEPTEDNLTIRYRIDGILRNVYALPKRTQRGIAARIKIISQLDITKSYVPQDGRFPLVFQERQIDFRVSSLPTIFGEKFVLRILDKSSATVNLEQLGFSARSLQMLREAAHSDHGMILITGPTGSGKSTTLYSMLSELNTLQRHIVTIEDPVEYQLNGIGQTQIRSDINFNFSTALRGLLRQSPDVIMVGEIRDFETADIAIKASLIGQLILSTLHTNDAVSAFARLIDMGVERYLAVSALILICAQRLCRKICQHCKEPLKTVPEYVYQEFGISDPAKVTFYRGRGCNSCYNTGYKGRVALLEALRVDDQIKGMVMREEPFESIKEACIRESKLVTLRKDGVMKALEGVITIEEIYRVTARD